MLVILTPQIVIGGIITFVIYFKELRKQRLEGDMFLSNFVLLLWFGLTVGFFFSSYNAYIHYITVDPWDGAISPSDGMVYWATLMALVPSAAILLLLSITSLAERVALKKSEPESFRPPAW